MKKLSTHTSLRQMLRRYVSGKASAEETRFLETYYDHFESEGRILDELSETEKQEMEQRMEAAIFNAVKERPVRKIFFRAAAAVLTGAVLTLGLYQYFKKEQPLQVAQVQNKNVNLNDIAPGGNKAILTLGNGRKISLDDSKIGELSRDGNAVITKSNAGQIVYDPSTAKSNNASSAITYNTVQTPVGGEFQLVLADGTKVWLNADSKLEFPTEFRGAERVVRLSGEGYFEVAKNAAMPFKVKVNDVDVKVLGTHFNIKAYANEGKMKTTLLEGSVNILKGSSSKILKPGEQAVTGTGDNIEIKNGDLDEALAWKNGYFKFERDDIQYVMRQLSRWYDMEVVYAGKVPADEFSGKIRRNVTASTALQYLELTNVHFKIEGKKVIVLE
jgi:transmembrane sensor